MTTNTFRVRLPSTRVLAVLLLAFTLFGATSRAQAEVSVDSILLRLVEAQNLFITTAAEFQTGHQPDAATTLRQALTFLNLIAAEIDDPAVRSALGRKYKTLVKKVAVARRLADKARLAVDGTNPRLKPKAVVNAVRIASKGVSSAGLVLGRPLLSEVTGGAAGFHTPGQVVNFRIDTAACGEPPTVVVTNAGVNPVVDRSSVSYDPATGLLIVRMGLAPGGARVQVTACGKTVTRLLYNWGIPFVAGLPDGFPQYLTPGNYVMTADGTAVLRCEVPYIGEITTDVPFPSRTVGTYQLISVKGFARTIAQDFNTTISSVAPSDCPQTVTYSTFDGDGFSVNYAVRCVTEPCTTTANITFTLRKQ